MRQITDKEKSRLLEEFAENHPVPTAADIVAFKSKHPNCADEIVELSCLLLELAFHKGHEEEHVLHQEDLRVVERVFMRGRPRRGEEVAR